MDFKFALASFWPGFIALFFAVSVPATEQVAPPLSAKEELQSVPVEAYFAPTIAHSFRMSPNGKLVAFVRKYTQGNYLVVVDLEDYKEIYKFPLSALAIQQLSWINDNQLCFGKGGQIYSVNKDGTDMRVLISTLYDASKVKGYISYKDNLRYWTLLRRPTGAEEEVLFQSFDADGYANIHKVNIYTGEKKDLYNAKKLKANMLHANHDGMVQLAEKIDDAEHDFYLLHDQDNKQSLEKLTFEGDAISLDYDAKSYLGRRVILQDVGFEKGELYLSESLTSDRFQLVKYNYLTKEKQVIGVDKNYDVGNVEDGVSIYFDDLNKKLIGYSYVADKLNVVWLDERFKKYQATLNKKYPGMVNAIYDWNLNADKVLVRSYDSKSRGKILVFDPVKNKTIVLIDYSEDLKTALMQDTQMYQYKAAGGQQITAYLTPPAINKDKPWPLVVLPHGGPFARSYYGYDGEIQYLSSRGYAVLEPNFRGSIGYGRDFVLAGKQQLAGLMLADIADGARALISENKVDPNQVYIMGYSYGGYAALMSAVKYPDLYRAAVAVASPMDLQKQLKYLKKNEYWFAYEYWHDLLGAEEGGNKLLKELSPINHVDAMSIPVLVFHGKDDSIIPVEQAEDFKSIVEKKKLDIPVRIVQSEGHGWRLVSSKVYMMQKAIDLFEASAKKSEPVAAH